MIASGYSYGEDPNARYAVLRAPMASEAKSVAALYWDAWPSELEVWTTRYYEQRYGQLPNRFATL